MYFSVWSSNISSAKATSASLKSSSPRILSKIRFVIASLTDLRARNLAGSNRPIRFGKLFPTLRSRPVASALTLRRFSSRFVAFARTPESANTEWIGAVKSRRLGDETIVFHPSYTKLISLIKRCDFARDTERRGDCRENLAAAFDRGLHKYFVPIRISRARFHRKRPRAWCILSSCNFERTRTSQTFIKRRHRSIVDRIALPCRG